MTGEQGTREEQTRGDGTGRDKTRQRVTEQEGTREEKTRGDGTRRDKRREERCYTIPHTDKGSLRIHGSRGHLTRRHPTPRALNARVHSSPPKKGVRSREASQLRRPRPPPGTRPGAAGSTQEPLGPAQEHPRATQDHPGRPKSRPRDAKTAPGAAKRAPGAPGRLPGATQNVQKP